MLEIETMFVHLHFVIALIRLIENLIGNKWSDYLINAAVCCASLTGNKNSNARKCQRRK